ncbi:MAG: serine hydrolase, partial [Planctomycetota bacterium]
MPNVFPALVLCSAAALSCAAPSAGSRNESALEREIPPLDLESLLRAHPERFGDVLERADEHRLKIELAVVDDSGEAPRLVRSSLDFGPEYFYPASSVKTCAVVAALMDVRLLEAVALGTHVLDPRDDVGVTRDAALRYLPLFDGEEVYDRDPSHLAGGTVTIAHDVAKVLLVSDNPAYNRLYEFSGPDRIREVMRGAGLASTRIVHRMSEFRSPEEQLR